MDNRFEQAKKYILEKRFAVFPCHGIGTIVNDEREFLCCTCGDIFCKDPGKHPATPNGLTAATKDIEVLTSLWKGREKLNVAIATGAISDIFVVDVDGPIGIESLNKLETLNGKLPDTYKVATPRGGFHYYFKYPNRKVFSRTNKWEKIDIRGDGGYVIAPPSQHIRGNFYEIVNHGSVLEAPDWLIEEVCSSRAAPKINEKVLYEDKKDWSADEVRKMLAVLDPSCDRDTWLNIGMALNDSGYSFELFDSWSSRSPDKYDKVSCAKTWMSFKPGGGITMGTLVNMAKLNGWKPEGYITEDIEDVMDNHPAKKFLEKLNSKDKKTEEKPINSPIGEVLMAGRYETRLPFNPEELTMDHQLITDTVRWITSAAIFPQPELAFMATICCLGAVFGRRYACETYNTRTNIMMAGLCDTASGKDLARKLLKNLMKASGLDRYLGDDDIRSDAGLFTMMNAKPSCVMFIDEFGAMLKSIHDNNAQSYKASISRSILTIYSSSGSSIFPPSYADKKIKVEPLYNPNLCIYGVATSESYVDAMKKEAIATGDLNRYIILPGREEPDLIKRPYSQDVTPELTSAWAELVNIPGAGNLDELNASFVCNETPIIVKIHRVLDQLDEMLITQVTEQRKNKATGLGGLWGRYRENCMKIAMILAITRDPVMPVIYESDLIIAEKTVRASIEYMMEVATERMYESPYDKDKKDIFLNIKASKGIGLTRAEIMKRFTKLNGKMLTSILSDLLDDGSIKVEAIVNDKCKPIPHYFWNV